MTKLYVVVIILMILTAVSLTVSIISMIKLKKMSDFVNEKNNDADKIKILENKINNITVGSVSSESPYSVRKVGISRYNAFDGMSGNYSFSLAMLDGQNSGVIFTSLFGHESCNNYLREVRNGKTSVQLSKEEQTALINAMEKL